MLAVGLSGGGAWGDTGSRDKEVERFLLLAEVVEVERIGAGITVPRKLTLELDGETRKAVFKSVESERAEPERLEPEEGDLSIIDSCRHEIAAYRLDRLLGIDMVPVAVMRKIDARPGAVLEWIPSDFDERRRRKANVAPRDPRVLSHQQDVMELFDALILNLHRDASSQLITQEDWKLHLIDHSRAFRQGTVLPRTFVNTRASLPRSLLDRLEGLDADKLERALGELLGVEQMAALLQRRDKILEKVAADRKEYGDAVVFQD
jgi:hypothetical protein